MRSENTVAACHCAPEGRIGPYVGTGNAGPRWMLTVQAGHSKEEVPLTPSQPVAWRGNGGVLRDGQTHRGRSRAGSPCWALMGGRAHWSPGPGGLRTPTQTIGHKGQSGINDRPFGWGPSLLLKVQGPGVRLLSGAGGRQPCSRERREGTIAR